MIHVLMALFAPNKKKDPARENWVYKGGWGLRFFRVHDPPIGIIILHLVLKSNRYTTYCAKKIPIAGDLIYFLLYQDKDST